MLLTADAFFVASGDLRRLGCLVCLHKPVKSWPTPSTASSRERCAGMSSSTEPDGRRRGMQELAGGPPT